MQAESISTAVPPINAPTHTDDALGFLVLAACLLAFLFRGSNRSCGGGITVNPEPTPEELANRPPPPHGSDGNSYRRMLAKQSLRGARVLALLAALTLVLSFCGVTRAASYRTPNFACTAATPDLARECCEAAEQFRGDLAEQWAGQKFPNWAQPCVMTVRLANNTGGGATSFNFDRGQVFGWTMNIEGTRDALLGSVIVHEVNHTVFATMFRQPLPRWLDEGACTAVEMNCDRIEKHQQLIQFLRSGRAIEFNQLFALDRYPADVMPLYAEGTSLCTFLLKDGGPEKFIAFVRTGLQRQDWRGAVEAHYGHRSLAELQQAWLAWIRQGAPADYEQKVVYGRPRCTSGSCGQPMMIGGMQSCPTGNCPLMQQQQPGRYTMPGRPTFGNDPNQPRPTTAVPITSLPPAPAKPAEPSPAVIAINELLEKHESRLGKAEDAIAILIKRESQPGPKGDAGEPGLPGPAGPQGPAGNDAKINIDQLSIAVLDRIKNVPIHAEVLDEKGSVLNKTEFYIGGSPLRLQLIPKRSMTP